MNTWLIIYICISHIMYYNYMQVILTYTYIMIYSDTIMNVMFMVVN